MPDITFTIPNDQFDRVKTAFLVVHPNTEKNGAGDLIYTDNQWLKEVVRRGIIGTVRNGEAQLAVQQATESLQDANNVVDP